MTSRDADNGCSNRQMAIELHAAQMIITALQRFDHDDVSLEYLKGKVAEAIKMREAGLDDSKGGTGMILIRGGTQELKDAVNRAVAAAEEISRLTYLYVCDRAPVEQLDNAYREAAEARKEYERLDAIDKAKA